MRLILVSNDDGVSAPGIRYLADGLEDLGKVYISAPASQMSGTSHAITLGSSIRVERLKERVYAVHGTPVDSVFLGVRKILPRRPDIVVSGINAGYNLGEDVFYSGTVAAAREGAICGVHSLAVSLEVNGKTPHHETALHFAREIIQKYMFSEGGTKLLNLNVPNRAIEDLGGLKLTTMGNISYTDPVEKISDEEYRIGGTPVMWNGKSGTDLQAVHAGFASLTPLRIDITDHDQLDDTDA
jgi:5'-nucleotidase